MKLVQSQSLLGKRNLALLELLYATGIRVSECANIQLKDLDFDFATILGNGKGRKERYVPFGSFASEAFNDYIEECKRTAYEGKHAPSIFVR